MARRKTDSELVRMINAYWGAPVARIARVTHQGIDSRTGEPWSTTCETIVSDLDSHGFPASESLREAA